MRHLALSLFVSTFLATAANAAGSHSGGHEDEIAIGKPGKASAISRTVAIVMKEDDEGRMLFEPQQLAVQKGETLRLQFSNEGETDHEFVMDRHDTLMDHKQMMAKFPEMEHDDPNAIRLAPGAKGEIIWTFTNAGDFRFACLIPGHYEAGMHGKLEVAH